MKQRLKQIEEKLDFHQVAADAWFQMVESHSTWLECAEACRARRVPPRNAVARRIENLIKPQAHREWSEAELRALRNAQVKADYVCLVGIFANELVIERVQEHWGHAPWLREQLAGTTSLLQILSRPTESSNGKTLGSADNQTQLLSDRLWEAINMAHVQLHLQRARLVTRAERLRAVRAGVKQVADRYFHARCPLFQDVAVGLQACLANVEHYTRQFNERLTNDAKGLAVDLTIREVPQSAIESEVLALTVKAQSEALTTMSAST